MVEQPAFAVGAAAVAREGAVGSDDAVAGDDDDHGVGMAGLGHGTERAGTARELGQLAVADGVAVGDVLQLGPDGLLEVGAREVERQRELAACAGKVFLELAAAVVEQGSGALDGLHAQALGSFDQLRVEWSVVGCGLRVGGRG